MTEKEGISKDRLINVYLEYLKSVARAPRWVYQLTDQSEISKEQFYRHFSDIGELENTLWIKLVDDTLEVLSKDKIFTEYSTREKFLAFYFTLIEFMNDEKVPLTRVMNKWLVPGSTPNFLRSFKQKFKDFTLNLLKEGSDRGEIANRMLLNHLYPTALWNQCLFILWFWKNDKTKDSTATDEAIERSTNLGYDLMGHTPMDSLAGFSKFLYQNMKS